MGYDAKYLVCNTILFSNWFFDAEFLLFLFVLVNGNFETGKHKTGFEIFHGIVRIGLLFSPKFVKTSSMYFLHQESNLSCLDKRIKIAFLDSHCFKSGYIIDLCPLTNKCLIGIQKSKLDPKPMYSKEWLSEFQSWVNFVVLIYRLLCIETLKFLSLSLSEICKKHGKYEKCDYI